MSRAILKATQSQGLEYGDLKKHLDTTLFDGQILSRSEREQLVDYLFSQVIGGHDAAYAKLQHWRSVFFVEVRHSSSFWTPAPKLKNC